MQRLIAATLMLASTAALNHSRSPERVSYRLQVDSADLSAVRVEMRIHDAPADLRVAMATHSEYDDQYWRYLTDLSATTSRGRAIVTREDSSLWHVTGGGGELVIRYNVHYPATTADQDAWRAHLTPAGGLIGGPHSFLYVVGEERAPVGVTLALPRSWTIATGLTATAAADVFAASSAETLIDSPILVGYLRRWQFVVDGVTHGVNYLGQPGHAPFDTARLVSNVERTARATVAMFGSMPYRRYEFLLEEGTSGGLEHVNSVTIGIRSTELARDPDAYLGQIAHEYFHTWNEVHLRPAAWIGVRHVRPAPTGELWWAEGVTLYYADLLMRRAGLPLPDSTRLARLARLVAADYGNPSYHMVSPEHVSREFNQPSGGNGDYLPSMYVQGEMLGVLFDLMIRDSSKGSHTLDDAMRDLTSHFTPERGYTGADLERAIGSACGCNPHDFFDRHVRNAGPLDFDRGLAVLGLRSVVAWQPAQNADGTPAADIRVSGFLVPGDSVESLQIWFPATSWGRAGLHTGDRIISWNGAPIANGQQLRSALGRVHPGDSVRIVVEDRGKRRRETTVFAGGYDRPVVRLEEIPAATAPQRATRTRWSNGQR